MDSFEDWYRQVHPRVVTTLAAALGSPEAAADATADAFVKAYRRWDRVSRMDRPDGWVYRVAFNEARRHHRRRVSEAAALGEVSPSPTHHPVGVSALLEFAALVEGLPERMRHVVALRHVADLTEAEIGTVLGITRGTVSSTLRDAYRRIEQVAGAGRER